MFAFRYGYTYPRSVIYNKTKKVDYKIVTKSAPKDAQNRRVLVAWFVSHCKTQSYRENYVGKLRKYLEVSRYAASEGEKKEI